MRTLLLRLLTNRTQLFLLVLFLSALPMMRWFAAVLLVLVTLRFGLKAGSQLVVAMLIPVLYWIFLDKAGGLPVLSQVVNVLLLLALSAVLRVTRSWLLLLQLLTVLGLVTVLVVHWFYPDIAAWWSAYLKPGLASLKTLPAFFSGAIDAQMMPAVLAFLSHIATGLEVMIVSAVVLLNVAFGRYVQAALYNPGGLKKELYYLTLSPGYASSLMVMVLMAALSHQALGLDCLGVVLLPFIVSGLSLLHYLTARSNRQTVWLVFCYMALLLFPPEALVVLIGVSFIDAWWNIRQRIKR